MASSQSPASKPVPTTSVTAPGEWNPHTNSVCLAKQPRIDQHMAVLDWDRKEEDHFMEMEMERQATLHGLPTTMPLRWTDADMKVVMDENVRLRAARVAATEAHTTKLDHRIGCLVHANGRRALVVRALTANAVDDANTIAGQKRELDHFRAMQRERRSRIATRLQRGMLETQFCVDEWD